VNSNNIFNNFSGRLFLMDLDEFRLILSESKVDVWTMIDAAISVAAVDCADEMKRRRDGIVEKLYSTRSLSSDDVGNGQHRLDNGTRNVEMMMNKSPLTPESNQREKENSNEKNEEEEDADPYGGLFDDDDEQTQILTIKQQLENPQLVVYLFIIIFLRYV